MGANPKRVLDLKTRLKNIGVPDSYLKISETILEDTENTNFQNLICWISEEIRRVCNLECCVNKVVDDTDELSFAVEVNTLLRELECPYDSLLVGPITQRFQTTKNKKLLLDFLLSELASARIVYSKKHGSDEKMVVKLKESDTAKMLKESLIVMGFSKPPPTITPKLLFSKIEQKIKALTSEHNIEIDPCLFSGTLTEKQWFQLAKLQQEMEQDYKSRRVMVLERLNLTTQSFCWSSKIKNVQDKIDKICESFSSLSITPSVHIGDLLSAKTDLTIMEKTSGASVTKNTKSSIYSVLIGSVPDRGGRTDEQQPPPPEIPSWQKSGPSSQQKPSFASSPTYDDKQQPGRSFKNMDSQKSRSDQYAQPSSSYHDNTKHKGRQDQDYRAGSYPANVPSTGYPTQAPQFSSAYQFQDVNPYQASGGFGYGFGGYGATGGNFQQYGMLQQPVEMQQQQYYGNQAGGRGFSSRGGGRQRRPRGNYGHQQYGHQQHGHQQY